MRERMPGRRGRRLLWLVLLAVPGCQGPPGDAGGSAAASAASYVPGLGELMSLQQMRHTKLWLAGQALNWRLATYEIEELGEGFDDVLAYHPTHKDAPAAPRDLIPALVTEPLDSLQSAVSAESVTAFERAYDALTLACNDCHQSMDFGFNVVQRPESNPYPNQRFEPGP